ncbi:hypothetical protein A2U01_0038407, partial [Trifolium medium]|nr:hypothetical protein [Trifolium medium]
KITNGYICTSQNDAIFIQTVTWIQPSGLKNIQRPIFNHKANERAQGSEAVCPFRSHLLVRTNLAKSKNDDLEKSATKT